MCDQYHNSCNHMFTDNNHAPRENQNNGYYSVVPRYNSDSMRRTCEERHYHHHHPNTHSGYHNNTVTHGMMHPNEEQQPQQRHQIYQSDDYHHRSHPSISSNSCINGGHENGNYSTSHYYNYSNEFENHHQGYSSSCHPHHTAHPDVYAIRQPDREATQQEEMMHHYSSPQLTPVAVVGASTSFSSSNGSVSNNATPRRTDSIRSKIENDLRNIKASNRDLSDSSSSLGNMNISSTAHINHKKLVPKPASPGNKKAGKKSKMYSNYIGVTFNKTHGKYQACITHYRKQHYLGRYKLSTDAALAYDKGAKLLKGQGWKINFSSEEQYWSDRCKEEKGKLHNTGNNNVMAHVTMSPSSQCSNTATNQVVHSLTNYGEISANKVETDVTNTTLSSPNCVSVSNKHYFDGGSATVEGSNSFDNMNNNNCNKGNTIIYSTTKSTTIDHTTANLFFPYNNNTAIIPPKRNSSLITPSPPSHQPNNTDPKFKSSLYDSNNVNNYDYNNTVAKKIKTHLKRPDLVSRPISRQIQLVEETPSGILNGMLEAASALMTLNEGKTR